jgi:hypothetical protein
MERISPQEKKKKEFAGAKFKRLRKPFDCGEPSLLRR